MENSTILFSPFPGGLEETVIAAAAEFGEAIFQCFCEVEGGGFRLRRSGGFFRCGFFWLGRVGLLFDGGHLHGLEFDFGAEDGEEGVGAGSFGQGEEGRDDLVHGVVFDDAAAVKAGDGAAAGVEEAEVVVDLCCCCNG